MRNSGRLGFLIFQKLKPNFSSFGFVPFQRADSSLITKHISIRGICFSHSKKRGMDFTIEKERFLNLSLHEKRSEYACKDFTTLEKIPTWTVHSNSLKKFEEQSVYKKDDNLNKRVCVFRGDITTLEVDAIVNAANSSLRGGGGVDGAIHRAAGRFLLNECISLNGCEAGDAKITGGYKLPAKYVIHTVGPMGEHPDVLQSCYEKCLRLAKENDLRHIAFPCISTGIYGYPNKSACHVALKTVREFLEENPSCFDRVIFCLFLEVDVELYDKYLPLYFPV